MQEWANKNEEVVEKAESATSLEEDDALSL